MRSAGAFHTSAGDSFNFPALRRIVDGFSDFFPSFLLSFFGEPLTCRGLVGGHWDQPKALSGRDRITCKNEELKPSRSRCWMRSDGRRLPRGRPQELHVLPAAAAALAAVLLLYDGAQDVGRFV